MQADAFGARLVRELVYPLSDAGVLVAMVCFVLLTLLAFRVGILGIWLAVILVPALSRYLLMLLEARAHGRPVPVASIETFNPIDNFWSEASPRSTARPARGAWESKAGAVMLGRLYLRRLLNEGRDVEAVKLMSRCLLEDPRFRPLPDDREAARELAERMKRADLVRAMDLAEPTGYGR